MRQFTEQYGSQAPSVAAQVAQAYYDGAMAALGCDWWDDAPDFFALVSQGYALGKPLPPTMPKRKDADRG
jgi:hypothetical protein